MENLWSDSKANDVVKRHRKAGVDEDLAIRVYSTRLLGSVPQLVLHGGGNTSVKTRARDLLGEEWDVLCVKGSGWDMGAIEAPGLPAVKMQPLLETRKLNRLADEDMVALQRAALIDPASPNPSIETLLHAYIPRKFVDHTHSTAVLAIVDQPDSPGLCQRIYGDRFGFVPYVIPGFDLAKAAIEIYERNPDIEGLILDKHGIFTFADDARTAYERMIDAVTLAERHVAANRRSGALKPSKLPKRAAPPEQVLPIVRGAVAHALDAGRFTRFAADHRDNAAIMSFVNGAGLAEYANRGVPTPDLALRIKNRPVVLPAPDAGDMETFAKDARKAVADYARDYTTYFKENDARDDIERTMLDPMPRLAMVPGFGLIGFGRTAKAAAVAADIGENFVETVAAAEALGKYEPLPFDELFKLEYWPLEQAKLKGAVELPLTGQIAIVTGGAGAIGAATAAAFAGAGAHVVVADIDGKAAKATAEGIGNASVGVACDVTDPKGVRKAVDEAVLRYGGLDIAVSNAGAAWEGPIAEMDDATLRESFELNFFAHQNLAQAAVRIMKSQGTGGCLLFNTSKQAVNPGANFGAYGLPKASTLFLSRQYALECGEFGIRSNAVNADRIRSGLLDEEMIRSRAGARGVSVEDYMAGNLLGQEVAAEDVAKAFLDLALSERTTASVTTVDGGNIAAMLR